MVNRLLLENIKQRLSDPKAIVIIGPRQSGKSTLLKQLFSVENQGILWLNGDDSDVRQLFAQPNETMLRNIIGNHKILIIDEAQRIADIGICLKIIIDRIPGVKVIATGSSSFELANKTKESLTGRKWKFTLFPLSYAEMVLHHGAIEEQRLLHQRIIFGYYPDVVNNPDDAKHILKFLSDSYLYRDILIWERLLKPERLEKLLQALALQIGHEVSYNELAKTIGLDSKTVEKYIDLLEKAFVVFRLYSYSRNLRNELTKSRKVYFYDNGIRNAVISQFNVVDNRSDIGALWKNFMVSERKKRNAYSQRFVNEYFWRTQAQQEIDYIEESEGKLDAFEFKWSQTKKARIPLTFKRTYEVEDLKLLTPGNFVEFIT
jgi:uncharacterized protein